MRNALKLLALSAVLLGGFFVPAHAQSVVLLPSGCGTGKITNGIPYLTIDQTGVLCTSTAGGGGTSAVNLTQIQGAAPSAANPLWVSPATGATFPVSTTPPANFTTAQVSVTTSNTATVASRAGRKAVTITNITGTQPIYCSGTTATTANGQYIPAVAGANFTTATSAAINCIAATSAQTVSVAEAY